MNVTPLVTVLLALVPVVGTLGGVWIAQSYAERGEKRRREQEREDRAVADLRTQARQVSDLFLAERIAYERIVAGTPLGNWGDVYADHLLGESLYRLIQAANMIPDAGARVHLRLIVRSLTDDRVAFYLRPDHDWVLSVPALLNTAGEIAAAYARGDKPDLDGSRWYRRIEAASARVDAETAEERELRESSSTKPVRTDQDPADTA